jgi:peptidyl-dipeptidase Dcp
MNPLLEKFNTKYTSSPFGNQRRTLSSSFQELVKTSEKEIDEITNNSEEPTFENTIEAMAFLENNWTEFPIFFLISILLKPMTRFRKSLRKFRLLTEFSSKISQNEKLFERIKNVYDQKDRLSLNEEQQTLLNETYKGFVRSGALLNEEDKKKLEKINMDLSIKSLQFGQNALASTNAYFKHITDKEELKGIPEAILHNTKKMPRKRFGRLCDYFAISKLSSGNDLR